MLFQPEFINIVVQCSASAFFYYRPMPSSLAFAVPGWELQLPLHQTVRVKNAEGNALFGV